MTEIAYVTRAGAKLDHALTAFAIDVRDLWTADLGAHTGGFTDCLLRRGARRVYAVDTGHGVLHWRLRTDPRVVVKERTNALHAILPEPVDFCCLDLAWTRLALGVPAGLRLLREGGILVALLKTQYEARPEELEGGRLRAGLGETVRDRVLAALAADGLAARGCVESPIKGQKGGNTEYLLWLTK